MALIQLETYDALQAAGTPEPQARAAAEAAADMELRHTVMAERLNGIDSKLTVILWIMGIGFSTMLAAFWQIFLRLPR
jgi:hypothetical protein